MPRGVSQKREREYKELKNRFKKEGRYKGREEEVASRIVNKQRREYGETKGQKRKKRHGKSPDKNLPIGNYQEKSIPEIKSRLDSLSDSKVKQIRDYEKKHKNRKTLMKEIDRQLKAA